MDVMITLCAHLVLCSKHIKLQKFKFTMNLLFPSMYFVEAFQTFNAVDFLFPSKFFCFVFLRARTSFFYLGLNVF